MKSDAIIGAVQGVTKKWAKQRKKEDRDPGTGVPPNDIKNDNNNDYAFSGVVIRLTWRDFAAWQESYKAIPDLRAALQQRDDWLATLPTSDQRRKNWLVPTSNWLAKENQKQVGRVQSEPAYDPDAALKEGLSACKRFVLATDRGSHTDNLHW